MYKDALNTLIPKFGQPQTVVIAHLDNLSCSPPLKMHSSDSITSFASTISNLVGLEGVDLLNRALGKILPNMKESWALHTVKRSLIQPSLLHFNDLLAEKADAHERMRANATRNQNQANAGPSKTVTKNLSSNSKMSEKKPKQPFSP